jgi:hypothetical protein
MWLNSIVWALLLLASWGSHEVYSSTRAEWFSNFISKPSRACYSSRLSPAPRVSDSVGVGPKCLFVCLFIYLFCCHWDLNSGPWAWQAGSLFFVGQFLERTRNLISLLLYLLFLSFFFKTLSTPHFIYFFYFIIFTFIHMCILFPFKVTKTMLLFLQFY